MLLVGLVPHSALLGIFYLAALMQGLKGVFDAALQALVGQSCPPARRGQYTGLVELAWGGSSLIGLPVAGALLASRWQAMFLFLGAVQLVPALGLLLSRPLPPHAETDGEADADAPADALLTWREVAGTVEVQEIALSISLVVAAVDCATILFGVWLQEGRGLSTARVAAATLALGAADLGGELVATLVIDRVGVARARRAALLASALAAAALAGVADLPGEGGIAGGLVCHFAMFLALEVVIVALLAASALALPTAGGRVEALTIAGIGVGHVVGAFISLPLWRRARGRVVGYAGLVMANMTAALLGSALAARHASRTARKRRQSERSAPDAAEEEAAPAEAGDSAPLAE